VSGLLLLLSGWHFINQLWLVHHQHLQTLRTKNIERQHLPHVSHPTRDISATTNKTRVLYIVTSLSQFDSGGRATTRGHNRFLHTLLPVVRESTISMTKAGYQVDVYLITHYHPSPQHWQSLQASLPPETSLELWPEASPMGDSDPVKRGMLVQHTMALSR
jgi:hypothetical protein